MTRKTYHFDDAGNMHEGPSPRKTDSPSGDGWVFNDRHYAGLRAPDGTDISSRRKHREYMKRNGLTTADDYQGHWQRKAKERSSLYSGDGSYDRKSRREAVARAVYKIFGG